MSVSSVDGARPKGSHDRDERRKVEPEQAARFDAAMRRRKRPRQPGVEDAPPLASPPPGLPAWWMTLGSARPLCGPTAGGGATDAGGAAAIPSSDLEADRFVAGAQTRLTGTGLHVRFTQGAWAGMELQASLHAGQVVVMLRPLNRQQHKRLVEAKSSLRDEVASQTGEVIRLEIADATR